tara:strand:- start:60802 stop:61509 length:708 start_codon:yes stop_codon:yes gene_type:complete
MKRFKLAINLWFSVLALVLVILFVCLGCWQLKRAGQKQALLDAFAGNQQLAALTSVASVKPADRYRSIQLQGHFDNAHSFLLDNQSHKGQLGYQVLTPFIIQGNKALVLVNRGWVPMGASRQQLPRILPAPAKNIRISGLVNFYPRKTFELKNTENKQWPRLLQQLNFARIQAALTQPVAPTIVLLAANQRYGFQRDWQMATVKPARHQGYAVQWFALALMSLIGLVIVSVKRLK